MITNGQVGTIQIQGLEDLSKYKAYFVAANEYPLFDKLSTEVKEKEIKVFTLAARKLVYSLGALAMFTLAFFVRI